MPAPSRVWILSAAALCVGSWACGGADSVPTGQLEDRLVYAMTSPGGAEQREQAIQLIGRAKRSGYTGMALNDFRLGALDHFGDAYREGLRAFGDEAARRDFELIPMVGSIGWSEPILLNDPSLVEAMPVRGQPLRISGGMGRVVAENQVRNGGFEDVEDHAFSDWELQDSPGKATRAGAEAHGGAQALLLEDTPKNWRGARNGRVMQRVATAPWRTYRASMWVKTEGFQNAWAIRLFGMAEDEELLSYAELRVERTQDWRRYDVLINSRDHQEVLLYAGVWGGGPGAAWIDDVTFEEVALVNLVRRSGAELTVRAEDGTVYEEGRDFLPLIDPRMGHNGPAGRFDRYHEPPVLTLTENSRIAEGSTVLVDYYHAAIAKDNQASVCLGHPKVFELFEQEVRAAHELLRPSGYLLGHDEILAANWCGSCYREGRTAGELLAENVLQCARIVREVDPDARLYVWNDMFDPHHNAKAGQALVNGDFAGSWEGLPDGVRIFQWNWTPSRPASLRFFAERGFEQIVAGFYDGNLSPVEEQIAAPSAAVSSIRGAMYTTFRKDFSELERFASDAWGGAQRGPLLR